MKREVKFGSLSGMKIETVEYNQEDEIYECRVIEDFKCYKVGDLIQLEKYEFNNPIIK